MNLRRLTSLLIYNINVIIKFVESKKRGKLVWLKIVIHLMKLQLT